MAARGILEAEDNLALASSPPLTVAVAISGSKQSIWVLKWALEKFIPEGTTLFKLLHILPPITEIPTPLGTLPLSHVAENVVAEYKNEIERRTTERLLPYKCMCDKRKVQVDVIVIEADDVTRALSREIAKFRISKLVIGKSPGFFTRKLKSHNSSTRISECTPKFCSVYVVSKGNLAFVCPSTSVPDMSTKSETTRTSDSDNRSSNASSLRTGSTPNHSKGLSLDIDNVEEDMLSSYSFDIQNDGSISTSYKSSQTGYSSQISARASITEAATDFNSSGGQVDNDPELERLGIELRRLKEMYAIAQNEKIDASLKLNNIIKRQMEEAVKLKDITSKEKEARELERQEKEEHEAARKEAEYMKKHAEKEALQRKQVEIKDISDAREEKRIEKALSSDGSISTSYKSAQTGYSSQLSASASISETATDFNFSGGQVDNNLEVERLGIELRHLKEMYAIAQNEKIDASLKLNNIIKRQMEEPVKIKEITTKEKEARKLERQKKEKHEAARKEAEYMKKHAEKEPLPRKQVEIKDISDASEEKRLEKSLTGPVQPYKIFTWEEIISATSSFSEHQRIGMGTYGTVYKCSLNYTTAALKVLHSKEGQWTKQFEQELEILRKITHPHLLLLLGACPDHGCLIFEYMENGSLDERLLRKDNTPPIPWFERYRIAWEVASALNFLHNSKPKPIIHCDLKPTNILLDHNFISKIGDVGLSKLLPSDHSSVSTMYRDTGLVGTFCYTDPEYQRTGLISPMSDVYAFGMVILQLLTAKPAMALTCIVEEAIENGRLMDILDLEAGKWPIEETQELAVLGLRCTEIRRRDRPDLKTQVLPVLEKLKEIGDEARNLALTVRSSPPQLFICPILQDVMDDPCVAADGYTYDRKAIEIWLKENDNSPMTNLPLLNKNLLPNYALLSALMEWKSRR